MLLDNPTLAPPDAAALVRVTLQALVAPEFRVVGLHVTEANAAGGTDKVNATVWEALPKVAVSTAVPSEVIVPTVTLKLAEVAPAGTVTAAGTLRTGLLLDSTTLVPPEGAALVRVTVQALLAPEYRVVELHVAEVSVTSVDKVNETVWEALPRVAVSTAVPFALMVPAVAVKLAEVAPATTVTVAGTLRAGLLLDSPTLVPPAGAALVRVTVQALVAAEPRVVGVQVSEASATGADKVNETVWEALPRVAVSTAVPFALMVPAVAVKLAEVAPATTVTVAGTLRAGLLLDSPTLVPPAGAALVRVTVQALVAAEPKVVGLQVTEASATGADKVNETVGEALPRVAVSTAVPFALMVPAVAVKLAEVAPATTVTVAGTLRAGLLLDSPTLVPPAGAALVRVTVQALVAAEPKVVGLQVTEASATGADKVNETVGEALPRVAVSTAVPFALMVPAVAVKLAEVAPATTVTVAGTLRAGLLLDSPTLVPPAGAALVRVTVQALVAAEPKVVGLQVTEASATGADKVNETVGEALPRVAVSTAVPFALMVPAVAVKLAEVAPATTVTVAGTLRAGLLLDSPTLVPPAGAALVRVTVQALVAAEPKVVGVQVTEASATGADKVNETVGEALPRVAVSTAVPFALMVPAVAVKLAEVAPATTVTVAGTLRAGLLLDSPTTVPPVGAAALKLTVQADVPDVASEVGLQLKELRLTACTTDTIPPVAEIGRDVPPAVLATGFVTPIVVVCEVVVCESVTVTVATTPLEIVLRLSPAAKQV